MPRPRPALTLGLTPLEDRTVPAYTLQILHASDFEGGVAAVQDAPNFAAVVDRLEDVSPSGNSITLSSGDNFIPGPFFAASGDPAVAAALGGAGANSAGRADIRILNQFGVQASVFGNHEFDNGPREIFNQIVPAGAWQGALFPYLSTNLDFSADGAGGGNLASRTVAAGQDTTAITAGRIAPTAVITENGERIGVVGVTTPLLPSISSPGAVVTRPADPADLPALAAIAQTQIDALTAAGVNKIVVLSHLQQIALERQLAPLLRDVDVLIAGGSNTLLADSTDILRPGDVSQGQYAEVLTGADGNPTVLVNTDGNYQYVGRLVLTFSDAGVVDPASLDPAVNGAYATDAAGVDRVYAGTGLDPFAPGTRGADVRAVADAVGSVINAKDGTRFGRSEVYLNGLRGEVRTQETNLGNLSADANLFAARQTDPTVVVSLKNGGGVRDSIGTVDPATGARQTTVANPGAGKLAGEVSQLDVENSLRFNNTLAAVTITAAQFKVVLEHAVAAVAPGATPGQFPQVGGVRFSFDAARPAQVLTGNPGTGAATVATAGSRIRSAVLIDDSGATTQVLVENGFLVGDPARLVRLVTLGFLADDGTNNDGLGGDGYPLPSFAQNRVNLESAPGTALGEQRAFTDYLTARFPVGRPGFNQRDEVAGEDGRIQNLASRADTVTRGALTPAAISGEVVDGDPDLYFIRRNTENGAEVTHVKVTAVFPAGVLTVSGGPVTAGTFLSIADRAVVRLTAPAGFAGEYGFEIQASVSPTDAGLGGSPFRVSFTIVNSPPAVTTIPDVVLPAGAATTGPIPFQAADEQGAVTVTAASGNPLLVPAANIAVAAAAGGGFTVTVTPAAGQSGAAVVTLAVTDAAGLVTTRQFTVTVPPNAVPTLAPVADVTVPVGGVITIPLTVADADGVDLVVVTAASSNPDLLAAAGIVVTGTGADRTVTVTPTAGRTGTAVVTLTATDAAGGAAVRAFAVTVNPTVTPPPGGNTAPTIAPVADVTVPADGFTPGGQAVVAVTLADADGVGGVVLTATSSNPDLIPSSGIVITGTGANRTVTVPRTGRRTGTAVVTLTATDAAGATAVRAFAVTVVPGTTEGVVPPLTAPRVRVLATSDGPVVRLPDGSTTPVFAGFTGPVFTAIADVTGDGVADVVVGAGPGGGPRVKVFDGATGAVLRDFFAYEPEVRSGVYVAAGDVTGDGRADIIAGTGVGGGPRVQVFDGVTGGVVRNFFAYEPEVRSGVTVAAADITGDGVADIITGTGPGGGPRVRVFSGATGGVVRDFFALDAAFRGGVTVAGGDVTGDGRADVLVGAGPGGGPRVQVYDGATGGVVTDFFAADAGFQGGVEVGVSDADRDGVRDVVATTRPAGGAQRRAVNARTGAAVTGADLDDGFLGGVVV